MQALSTAALLDAWERGIGLSLFHRALTLLAAASPGTPPDRLAMLTIGQRDSCLVALREITFGRRMTGVVECPRCHARLELAFDSNDLPFDSASRDADAPSAPETFTTTVGEIQVEYRLPNSTDLAAIAGERDIARARSLLLQRCIVAITCNAMPVAHDAVSAGVLDAAVQHMGRVDPQGDVQVMFACPNCQHQREVAFDIASFFWKEIDAWAMRTLRDVHTLASTYGWREADILAMSAQRRQLYLDLA